MSGVGAGGLVSVPGPVCLGLACLWPLREKWCWDMTGTMDAWVRVSKDLPEALLDQPPVYDLKSRHRTAGGSSVT